MSCRVEGSSSGVAGFKRKFDLVTGLGDLGW